MVETKNINYTFFGKGLIPKIPAWFALAWPSDLKGTKMLTNDTLAQWDRENFFHPSTHLAQHARGETATRVITGFPFGPEMNIVGMP